MYTIRIIENISLFTHCFDAAKHIQVALSVQIERKVLNNLFHKSVDSNTFSCSSMFSSKQSINNKTHIKILMN